MLVEIVPVRPALLAACSALNLAKSNGADFKVFRAFTFKYCELELTYLQAGQRIPFQVWNIARVLPQPAHTTTLTVFRLPTFAPSRNFVVHLFEAFFEWLGLLF